MAERIALLLVEFEAISVALREVYGPIGVEVPDGPSFSRLSHLKKYEDALDAVVSCWVGMLYANREAVPLGDESAAIWCPRTVVSYLGRPVAGQLPTTPMLQSGR